MQTCFFEATPRLFSRSCVNNETKGIMVMDICSMAPAYKDTCMDNNEILSHSE